MRMLLMALLFLGAMVGGTSAASFDCAAAATEMEVAICGHEALSQADETLAVAYATAVGGLSKSATNAMRADQRAWLDFARALCIDQATDTSIEARGECLLVTFNNRIATLEESRMLGGHRFYIESGYTVAPDPYYADDPDSPWRLSTEEFAVPRADGDDGFAQGFNAMLDGYLTVNGLGPSGEANEDDSSADIDYTLTLEEALPSRITLREDGFWYGHGAAHGNYTITYLHYLIPQARQLEASDVFTAEGWESRLAELTAAALEAEHGDALFEDYADTLDTIVTDPQRWRFGDYGLIIQFQPYEVSAYAYGAPTATVTWEELDGLTSDTLDAVRWGY